MLGKLIKYEFKNTAKVMLTLYVLCLLVTLFGSIVCFFDYGRDYPTRLEELIIGTTLLLYVLTLFIVFILTFIYICIHFYKTMYSEQGYLTHTLPVTPAATFHAKLLTAFVWELGTVLLIFISVIVLLLGATRGDFLAEADFLFQDLDDIFLEFGITLDGFLAYAVVSMILGCLTQLLLVYASLSIGQLFRQHKIAAAAAAGIVIYFTMNTIQRIIAAILNLGIVNKLNTASQVSPPDSFWGAQISVSLILSFVFILALYGTCMVIVQKHINLD